MKNAALCAMVLLFYSGCLGIDPTGTSVLFEDDFAGKNVNMSKPSNWQWWIFADKIWIDESEDAPEEYGPEVMTLGNNAANGNVHLALTADELNGVDDYRVTVLWSDRLVAGEMGDADFHIGVRCQTPEGGLEKAVPDRCYELEVDGDGADATNLMPEEGPTHFHLFIRDATALTLGHVSEEVFEGPVRKTWYWTSVEVVGNRIRAKQWTFGGEEPDWQLEAVDEENRFPSGGVRLGVWSGKAEVAYVRIDKAFPVATARTSPGSASGDMRETGAPWEAVALRQKPDGTLVYLVDEQGFRIPDFSYVGYKNGNAPIPDVPVVASLHPLPGDGDDTARIQAALDEVSRRPPASDGFRGALELSAGEYTIEGTLRIESDGVVLRGVDGTVLNAVGNIPEGRSVIVAGSGVETRFDTPVSGSERRILTPYLPVGERSFEVDRPEGLVPGDNVIIVSPATEAWVEALDGGGTGADSPWRAGEQPLVFSRYIESIRGRTITINAPLYHQLDASLAEPYLYLHDRRHIRTNIGIEKLELHIIPGAGSETRHAKNGIDLIGLDNGWVREVRVTGFQLAGVRSATATRISVLDVEALDPVHPVETGWLYNFNAEAASQQILYSGCYARNGRHHFVSNGTSWNSGLVYHRTLSEGAWATSEGHRRYTTGILFDVHTELDGPRKGGTPILLGLYNRGDYGSGHGWSAAHSVIWNSDAADGFVVVQKPAIAQNWAVGVRGARVTGRGPFDQPAGYIEGANKAGLQPESLYEAQRAARGR